MKPYVFTKKKSPIFNVFYIVSLASHLSKIYYDFLVHDRMVCVYAKLRVSMVAFVISVLMRFEIDFLVDLNLLKFKMIFFGQEMNKLLL